MKVILLERVKSLGSVGEIVSVAQGYARNFLLPRKLAVVADKKSENVIKDKQKALAKKIAQEKQEAQAVANKLKGLSIELVKKVGANGKLFGSVTTNDISLELAKKDVDVEKRLLSVDRPVKSVGTYTVTAKLFKDVAETFELKIEADPEQAEKLRKEREALKRREEEQAKAKAEAEALAKAEEEGESEEASEE